MSDTEKLLAYAKEVEKMLSVQAVYFKASGNLRKGLTTAEAVQTALKNSFTQEKRVRALTAKVLLEKSRLAAMAK